MTQDEIDAWLFRFWCKAASYPGGRPGRLMELFHEQTEGGGNMTPNGYRAALIKLAKELGANVPFDADAAMEIF